MLLPVVLVLLVVLAGQSPGVQGVVGVGGVMGHVHCVQVPLAVVNAHQVQGGHI